MVITLVLTILFSAVLTQVTIMQTPRARPEPSPQTDFEGQTTPRR